MIQFNKFIEIISRPDQASNAKYMLKDSVGNLMQCISVIEIIDFGYKYAAVYHTPYLKDDGKYYYRINLSKSNDLIDWEYVGVLVENADMPEIKRIENSDWIVLIHEQWHENPSPKGEVVECHIGFKLFHDDKNLLSCCVNATWTAPLFENKSLNGTPNIYELEMNQDEDGYSFLKGSIGFHFWDDTSTPKRDKVASAEIENLFTENQAKETIWFPEEDSEYNSLFINSGVTGNIGQRANIIVDGKRYNLQEANIGRPAEDFGKWRIYLYQYNGINPCPTGNGEILGVFPQTENKSKSFGNPRIAVVKSPNDENKTAIVVSYFIFAEDSGEGEDNGLLYYFDLPE